MAQETPERRNIIIRKNYPSSEKLKKVRTEGNRKYYQKTAIYPRRAWEQEEIAEIMERKISDRELSKKLQRSMKSIVNKRSSEKWKNRNCLERI